jgi:hypothetical protein
MVWAKAPELPRAVQHRRRSIGPQLPFPLPEILTRVTNVPQLAKAQGVPMLREIPAADATRKVHPWPVLGLDIHQEAATKEIWPRMDADERGSFAATPATAEVEYGDGD